MTVAESPGLTDRIASIAFAPLHWVERARGRKRLAFLFLYAILAAIAAFFLWWSQSLRDLPDIGDSFAAIAYRAKPVSEAENAFLLYLQASAGLKTLSKDQDDEINKCFADPWSSVKPKAREALELHRKPLLLWRQATERSGLDRGKDEGTSLNDARITFPFLAMLEASRLADQGDMAGAWPWYRAVLRAQGHMLSLAEDETFSWRIGFHPAILPGFLQTLSLWAADPRVDAGLLREALTEAQALDAAMPSFASSMRARYRWSVNFLEASLAEDQRYIREDEWYKATPVSWPTILFLNREPERSRRILRLVYANLAAHGDDLPSQRPRLVPPGIFDTGVDPSGKDSSRRITPQDLQNEITASMLPKPLRDNLGLGSAIKREQSARASILINLATQLYEREHGTPPNSVNDLVGPYLDRLPAGAVVPSSP